MYVRPTISRRFLLFITLLALSSQACAISLIDWGSFFPTATPGGPNNGLGPTPQARAEVTFTVRLPDPLAQGESLLMSVVDEVTGIALNPVDYQMTLVDSITYNLVLAIPDQAVIKYRYVRTGGLRVYEDTNSDLPIRYRMLKVSGPTQIVDTVSSWSDKPVNTLSGKIEGTVTNQR